MTRHLFTVDTKVRQTLPQWTLKYCQFCLVSFVVLLLSSPAELSLPYTIVVCDFREADAKAFKLRYSTVDAGVCLRPEAISVRAPFVPAVD